MMRRGLWIGIGVVVVLFLVVLMVFGSYVSAKNQMVAKQEAVRTQWSQVDVVLQRRADLIPNLVATVKGYATHEETVFADIANARAGLLNAHDPAGKIQANGQLDSALGRLLAISENYPNLKADQNFLSLQAQLEGSENRIAVERRRYNETLRDYNTFIRQFPNSIWAGIAGFQPNNAYFEASESSRQAPTVKF
ncbi:MAG: LemA family protein [Silvibacterium sp.]|jgi:LemA protein|nr:LemA family protein [Silvibacterium sp.]HTA86741.1 LemA family protein [Silvibacterium sp.]